MGDEWIPLSLMSLPFLGGGILGFLDKAYDPATIFLAIGVGLLIISIIEYKGDRTKTKARKENEKKTEQERWDYSESLGLG